MIENLEQIEGPIGLEFETLGNEEFPYLSNFYPEAGASITRKIRIEDVVREKNAKYKRKSLQYC